MAHLSTDRELAADRELPGRSPRAGAATPAHAGEPSVLALQRAAGNRAVAGVIQRVDYRRGRPVDYSEMTAQIATQHVRDLQGGDWESASITHVLKLERRIAHLARRLEEHDKDAARPLWQLKKEASVVLRRVRLRESNSLEGFSNTEVSEAMERHSSLIRK